MVKLTGEQERQENAIFTLLFLLFSCQHLFEPCVTALTTKTVRAGGGTHCCQGTGLRFLQTGGVAELFGGHAGDVLEELGEE